MLDLSKETVTKTSDLISKYNYTDWAKRLQLGLVIMVEAMSYGLPEKSQLDDFEGAMDAMVELVAQGRKVVPETEWPVLQNLVDAFLAYKAEGQRHVASQNTEA